MLTDNNVRATGLTEEPGKDATTSQNKSLAKNPSDRGFYFGSDLDGSAVKKKARIQLPQMTNPPQLRRNKSTVQHEASKDGSSHNRSEASHAVKPDPAALASTKPSALRPEARYCRLTQRAEVLPQRLRVAPEEHPPPAPLEQARLLEQLPQENRRHRRAGGPQKQEALPPRGQQHAERVRGEVLHLRQGACHSRQVPEESLRRDSGPQSAVRGVREARRLHQLEQRPHPSPAARRLARNERGNAALVLPAEHASAQPALSGGRLPRAESGGAARLPGKLF